MFDLTSRDIMYLPGVGPQRAAVLNKELSLHSLHDLLYYFPYKYVDRSRLYYIHEIDGNMPYIQLKGEILSFETFGEGRQRRLVAHFSDGTGVVDLVWFQGIKYLLGRYKVHTEYIVFSDLDASASASATTRTRTRATFSGVAEHADERTINEPDMLYGTYVDAYEAQRTVEPVQLPLTLRPLVYTYVVRYEFSHGLEYVALARGGLSGMAESVYLQDGHTDEAAATILYDCTLEDYGAEAQVQTFGIPNYPGEGYTRADQTYMLNLEVRLNNGLILDYDFDVTAQVEAQPRGGIIRVSGIEVKDEDGQAGGGAFDVDVEGWGEYIDIPLPLE